MDFLLLGLQIAVFITNLLVLRYIRELSRVLNGVDRRTRTRQSTSRSAGHGSEASPAVDAKARTTRRDTDDLALTGRMGRLQPRMGGELDDRKHDDGGLS